MASQGPKLISTYTATGSETSITLSSIPQTYTDLLLKISCRFTNNYGYNLNYGITFNSDTGTYDSREFKLTLGSGINTGAALAAYNEITYIRSIDGGNTANMFTNLEMYIPSYTDTTKYKSTHTDGFAAGVDVGELGMHVGRWRNTSAISSLKIQGFSLSAAMTFAAGSKLDLYGIKNS